MTFWGSPKRLGLLLYFMTVATMSPPSHAEATVTQGRTGRPGTVEAMLETAGLRLAAVRALAAAGPSQPAIAHSGTDQFAAQLRKALAPLEDEDVGLRLSNEFGYITSTRP